MFEILAPAKLNLTLEVLGKRSDGYHEIRSVIQTISLSDSLSFASNEKLEFECDLPHWSADESLVSCAASLLQETTDCRKGARIKLSKKIPLMAGLGGDSSDAATTLRGLNKLWNLKLSTGELHELATQLGSDVSFFLYGGTGLMEGRGERVTLLPPMPQMWVVLVVPSISRGMGKTGQLYGSLKAHHYTDGQFTEKLVDRLKKGEPLLPSMLFNTFENVAFDRFPDLEVYRQHIVKVGADHVHLAGSGPALFTLFDKKSQAEELYTRLKQQNMTVYLAETLDPAQNGL